jgi:hypothetical protein
MQSSEDEELFAGLWWWPMKTLPVGTSVGAVPVEAE